MRQLSLIALVLIALSPIKTNAEEISFRSITIEEATQKASVEGKNIFVSYEAAWCLPCQIAKETIYSDPEVIRTINEDFIAVRADQDVIEFQDWYSSYAVCCLPTMNVVNDEGTELDRLEGTTSISEFKAFLSRNKKMESVLPAQYEILQKVAIEDISNQTEKVITRNETRLAVIQFGAFSNLANAENLKNKLEPILLVDLIIHNDTKNIYKVLHVNEITEEELKNIIELSTLNGVDFFVKSK